MLDIRLLRDKPDDAKAAFRRLGDDIDLDAVLAMDQDVRKLKNDSEAIKAEQNRLNKGMGKATPEERETIKAQGAALKRDFEALQERLVAAQARFDERMLELPNLPHPSVPTGKDDSENKVVREEGKKRNYDFALEPHWDLGTRLGIIDFDRGAKVSGSRFYMLKGWGARLQRALITFMLDLHTSKHGYTEVLPPVMVRR